MTYFGCFFFALVVKKDKGSNINEWLTAVWATPTPPSQSIVARRGGHRPSRMRHNTQLGQLPALPTTYFGCFFFALVAKKNKDFNHKRVVDDGMSNPHPS